MRVVDRILHALRERLRARSRRLLPALAASSALVMGVLGSSEARADCGLALTTVTCAPPGTNGFDAGALDGLTVNVQSNATVDTAVGAGAQIQLNDSNTVTNNGAIAGSGIGISAGNGNTIINNGTVVITNDGVGIEFRGADNTLNNFGLVRATGLGFSVEACSCTATNATVNNHGTLDGFLDVSAPGGVVNNYGLITITDPDTTTLNLGHFVETFNQFPGGTLALRVDSFGNSDVLFVDVLNPAGTLKVNILPGIYLNQSPFPYYEAVVASTTATRGFDSYVSSSPFFTVIPRYDAGFSTSASYTEIDLELDRIPFNAVPGMTHNQQAVGNQLEPAYSPNLDPNSVAGQFFSNLLASTSLSVLDLLSGEGTAAAQNAALGAGSLFNSAMFSQGMSGGSGGPLTFGIPPQYAATPKPRTNAFAMLDNPATDSQWRAWAAGFGAQRSIDRDATTGSANQTLATGGGSFGATHVASDLIAGFALGASTTHFSVPDRATSGDTTGGHVGVFGAKTWGAFYAATALNYAHFDNATSRTITGVGMTETAKGRFGSDQVSARAEFGWKRWVGGYAVTPFVAIEPAGLWQRGYTETSTTTAGNPGILGLTYQPRTVSSLPTFLGAQIETRYTLPGGQTALPYARASWVHEFLPDRRIDATFVSVPTGFFTVDGARPASDAARIDAGTKIMLASGYSLFANLNGEFSDRARGYSAIGGIKNVW